ncbi:ATP-binding cassette domain-containing protein [Austwickia sp. TVS 96-490-7B]|uniref:ATP-binding cassette domain-containing protein n=1 Tax=Austwickia sp. TVS 96-490-7B TaxID=2830843 RepID=UPI00351D6FCF
MIKDLEYSFARTRKARKSGGARLSITTLTIPDGGWLHLTGVNGSGKSTLVKLILGILRPDHGKVLVCGHDAYHNRRILMQDTGVVWGHRSTLWWDASAQDALGALNAIYRCKAEGVRELQRQLISRLETQDYMSRPIRTLSLGQRQRVEILACLAHAPTRIFLDEPFVGLDTKGVECVRSTLEEFFPHATLVIIDHDSNALTRCERIDMADITSKTATQD